MRIGVISDIHGNIAALEAVLADGDEVGLDAYVFLGDLVFFGLHPQQCFDALLERSPLVCIKGNTDANLEEVDTFHPSSDFEKQLLEVLVDCDQHLSVEAKREIASWPISASKTLFGHHLLFCHGSPYHVSDKLVPDDTKCEVADRLEHETAELIFCGHTHMPGEFTIKGKHIVNVGAVGYSFDGDHRPSYAILEVDEEHLAIELRRVDYDHAGYRRELAQMANELPLFSGILYAIEHGKHQPMEKQKP